MDFVNVTHLSIREIDLEIHILIMLYHDLSMDKFIAVTKRVTELNKQRDVLVKQG